MSSSLMSNYGQDDPVSLVPNGWCHNQLGKLCDIYGGGRLGLTKEKHYRSSGILAFSASGPDGFVEQAEFHDKAGVILSAIGANCGRCFFAFGDWTTLANVQAIIPNDEVDARYLFYVVNRDGYWERSGSAQPFIKPSSIRSSWIVYPRHILEQTKIAKILSTVDQAIDQTEALIAKQQYIKIGLMQDLLTRGIDKEGKLRSEDTHEFKDSPLGRIPVEWKVKEIQELLADVNPPMRSGPFGSALLKEELLELGIPLLGIDNVLPEEFVPLFKRFVAPKKAKQLKQFHVRPRDVMVTIMGTVGQCCMVPDNIGEALSSKHVWTISFDEKAYSPYLACIQINYAPWILNHFAKDMQGGIMASIRSETLRSTQLPVPSLDEMREIEDRLRTMSNGIGMNKAVLRKLIALKAALMQDLLTGKVRVTPLMSKA